MMFIPLRAPSSLIVFFSTILGALAPWGAVQAQTRIKISDEFSSEEKLVIEQMFRNFSQIKGEKGTFYFSQIFQTGSPLTGKVDGQHLIEFMEKRFSLIRKMPEENAKAQNSESGAVFFRIAYQGPRLRKNDDGSVDVVRDEIFLNPQSVSTKARIQMSTMATLLHEAIHSGLGDPHPHVDCPKSFQSLFPQTTTLFGVKGACDEDEDGAYGTEAVFWGNLMTRVPDLSEDLQMLARSFFLDRMGHIISMDAQRRVLADLELNEKLERVPVLYWKKAILKSEYFERQKIADEKWKLKVERDEARKEMERDPRLIEFGVSLENESDQTITFDIRWGDRPEERHVFKPHAKKILRWRSLQKEGIKIKFDPYQNCDDPPLHFVEPMLLEPSPLARGDGAYSVRHYAFEAESSEKGSPLIILYDRGSQFSFRATIR